MRRSRTILAPVSLHDPEVRREIEAAIAEAVTRFGMAGDIFIEGTTARLVGAGAEVSTDLGGIGDQWPTLAPELRQRRATEIARRLVSARRARIEAGHDQPRRGVPLFVAPMAILLLAAAGVLFAWDRFAPGGLGFRFGAEPTASAPNVDEYERERAARAQRVCEATRSRILRGATVGPTDVEGWVVELVLIREAADPLRDPALGEYLSQGEDAGAQRFVWKDAPEIAAQQGLGTDVSVTEETGTGASGLRLTFHGKYVNPYFDPAKRGQYVKLANALAERLGASHGALYARCSLGGGHHLGSWFLGPTPGQAAAALVYWVGAFADPPHLRKSVLFPEGGGDVRQSGVFSRLGALSTDLDRKKLRTTAGEHDGMLTGEDEGRTVLTFPFADSNRAARASFSLAKTLGAGVER